MRSLRFGLLLPAFACCGAVLTYPAPEGVRAAPDIRVTVNGKEAFVYDSPVAPFVVFSFSGRAKVVVTLEPGATFPENFRYTAWGEAIRPRPFRPPLARLDVRPLNLGIRPKIDGNRFSFEIGRPANLSLEINGNLSRPLLVFAAPPEKAAPKPGDPGVRYFAAGKVYDVGRLKLAGNETVYIAGGAVVRGSIAADGISNARVMGRGILDGGDRKKVPGPVVEMQGSKNVRVEGIVILNEQGWTVIPRHSEDIALDNIKMIAWDNNSDGVDVVGSKRVRISASFLRTNDDCIAIKAMGEAPDTDVAGVEVRDTVFWNVAAGNAMEIGYELRTNSIRDVLVRDCDVIHAEGAALSVHDGDWATVGNIRYENIRIEDAPKRLIDVAIGLSIYSTDCPWRYHRQNPQREPVPQAWRSPRGAWFRVPDDDHGKREAKRGRVQGITMRNIRIRESAPAVCQLIGYSEAHPVRDVTFEGLWLGPRQVLSADQGGCRLEFAENVRFLPGK